MSELMPGDRVDHLGKIPWDLIVAAEKVPVLVIPNSRLALRALIVAAEMERAMADAEEVFTTATDELRKLDDR